MADILNISRAKTVNIDLFNYDQIPLSLKYSDTTVPSAPVAINITGYAFDFYLYEKEEIIQEYSIAAAVLSTAYLSKTGTGMHTLNTQLMWEHIKSKVQVGAKYRLVQVVTDSSANRYVHIVYNINAKRY